MSRIESDREDLFAELRSAVVRWELTVPGLDVPIVAGIRSGERFSIYLAPERCYHFDHKHRLKRAYVDEALYRTQGTTLARLIRVRSDDKVELQRTDLSAGELQLFLVEMRQSLSRLEELCHSGKVQLLRYSGGTVDEALGQLVPELRECLREESLAPAFPTRRS